jgi:membrane-bound inhibitor of C-type lysozyme
MTKAAETLRCVAGWLLASMTLAGCSLHQAQPTRSTRWVCDNLTEVHWHFVDQAKRDRIELRLDDQPNVHHLALEPDGTGTLYSDGELAFRLQGEQGLVYWVATNDLIGRGCTAPAHDG